MHYLIKLMNPPPGSVTGKGKAVKHFSVQSHRRDGHTTIFISTFSLCWADERMPCQSSMLPDFHAAWFPCCPVSMLPDFCAAWFPCCLVSVLPEFLLCSLIPTVKWQSQSRGALGWQSPPGRGQQCWPWSWGPRQSRDPVISERAQIRASFLKHTNENQIEVTDK